VKLIVKIWQRACDLESVLCSFTLENFTEFRVENKKIKMYASYILKVGKVKHSIFFKIFEKSRLQTNAIRHNFDKFTAYTTVNTMLLFHL
jgi:hypothetical protein